MQIWQTVLDFLQRHGRCAMVTVVDVKGSSPREAGARLFLAPDGSYRGTIGGGALEWHAIAQAQAAIAHGRSTRLRSAVLGPDLGQCCGGQVKILAEVFDSSDLGWIAEFAQAEILAPFSTESDLNDQSPKRRILDRSAAPDTANMMSPTTASLTSLVLRETFGECRRAVLLFGAGHVGRALILALAPLPFSVTWIDSRSNAFPSAVPANATLRFAEHPGSELDLAPDGSFVVVMTHSHATDFDLVLNALQHDRFAYVGVIGSETKRARFLSRLRAAGLPEQALDRLVCPIGASGITSKLPAAIAAATAVELLVRDEQLKSMANPIPAARRIA
jgi:xanthine dehydrogenase accessory factor